MQTSQRHRRPIERPEQGPAASAHSLDSARKAVLAVLGAAVLYLALQILLFPLSDYYMGRDEAIYLSQVVPGEPALDMAVHRVRGISLLLAPIGPIVGDSMLILRLWMALIGAAGIFLAFRPWVRSIGWAAPVAAFVFALGWINLFFGAQLYPNFAVAVGVVAAAGHFVAYLRDQGRADLAAVVFWIAFIAVVRPLESVLVAAGLWMGMLLFSRRLLLPATLALAAGGLLGFAPFFIEGWLRFGLDPIERLFAARPSGSGGGTRAPHLILYVNNFEGPVRCVRKCKEAYLDNPTGIVIPFRQWAYLGSLLFFSAMGLLRNPRRFATKAMYVAGLGALAVLAYYLQCECAVNLRYLQPAYALVAILVGGGVVAAWRSADRLGFGSLIQLGLVIVGLSYGAYQIALVEHTVQNMDSRRNAYELSQILNRRADGEPCAVAVTASSRQIQYFSDCLAVSLNRGGSRFVQRRIGGTTSTYDLNLLSQDGYQIFALARPNAIPEKSAIREWEVEDISRPGIGKYLLFKAPPGVEIESRYKKGYSREDAGPP